MCELGEGQVCSFETVVSLASTPSSAQGTLSVRDLPGVQWNLSNARALTSVLSLSLEPIRGPGESPGGCDWPQPQAQGPLGW